MFVTVKCICTSLAAGGPRTRLVLGKHPGRSEADWATGRSSQGQVESALVFSNAAASHPEELFHLHEARAEV